MHSAVPSVGESRCVSNHTLRMLTLSYSPGYRCTVCGIGTHAHVDWSLSRALSFTRPPFFAGVHGECPYPCTVEDYSPRWQGAYSDSLWRSRAVWCWESRRLYARALRRDRTLISVSMPSSRGLASHQDADCGVLLSCRDLDATRACNV